MPALIIPSSLDRRETTPPPSSHVAPTPGPPGSSRSPEKTATRSSSPQRPPVSPITPVASLAQLAPTDRANYVLPPSTAAAASAEADAASSAVFVPQPAPIPLAESENADIIALRSAISLLQMQREKSKRDLQTLESIKRAAVAEPEAFLQEARAGRLKDGNAASSDLLAPTLSGLLDQHVAANATAGPGDDGTDEKEVRRDSHHHHSERSSASREESSSPDPAIQADQRQSAKFTPIPTPQNIFRCPPINWSKYHVVGESLDKLHAEQLQRPPPGEPQRGPRAPIHVIAAPYSPFNDQLHPMQTRKGSKKPA